MKSSNNEMPGSSRSRSRSEGSQNRDCHVCSAPAVNSHFGVRVCRACAAFFRRTVAQNAHYTCRREGHCPISIRDRCTCRACRYQKCLDVGMQVSGVQCYREPGSFESRSGSSSVNSSSLSSDGLTFISRVQSAYAELQGLRKSINLEISLAKAEPHSMTYAEMNQWNVRELTVLADFVSGAFDECSLLPTDQMKTLFRHFFLHFIMFECAFVTFQSERDDVLCFPNGRFIDFAHPETFELNEDGTKNAAAEELLRLLEPIQSMFIRNIVVPMRELSMDETEFLVVASLVFWAMGLPDESADTDSVALRIRQRVMEETIEYFRVCKPVEDYGIRLSQLVLLIPPLQRLVHRLQSAVEISQVFDLYSLNQNLYEVMNAHF